MFSFFFSPSSGEGKKAKEESYQGGSTWFPYDKLTWANSKVYGAALVQVGGL